MANDNIITVIGNLTDDPELRYTPAGVPVASCRIAVNRRTFNRDTNSWDDRLDGYFTVNVWRGYAENAAESLRRGSRVLVMGRLISRSYEDKDGQTRWITEIEADEICPSLRWATAKITKVNRDSSGRANGDGGFGGAPTPAAPPDTDDVPF
ncbi:MAG: single-stranded DNA-binding protein [Egibacteraceae bacterium]